MSDLKKSTATQDVDGNVLLAAIKCCLLEQRSIRSSAREHVLDKSTLQRYVNKVKANYDDIASVPNNELLEFIKVCGKRYPSNMVFSCAQEKDLVDYAIKCMKHYYGLSVSNLKELAFQLANKLGLEYPDSWNENSKAGRTWYELFMKRHPQLTLRTPEQTSLHRVQGFCKSNVNKFFANLDRLLGEFRFDTNNIYNMDESRFSTVPTKIRKVIALKGIRRVGNVEGAERGTMVTMAVSVSASGNSIPPFFLFPRKRMQSAFLDNTSAGAIGFANESGWMTQSEFVLYIRHFIKYVKPTLASPVLLLLDNHTSHLSVFALDLAAENGVHMLSFPPHCSHKLQPFDVSIFSPVKTYYKSQCAAWQRNNANKGLEIRHIASLVCSALNLALTPKNIKSGFAKTGIVPYNPDVFSEEDFVDAVEQNIESVSSEAHLNKDELQQIVIVEAESVMGEEASTSQRPPNNSNDSSNLPLLNKIGPLQVTCTKKTRKRGRKPMESCELTSPENISALKEKAGLKSASVIESTAKKQRISAKKTTSTKTPLPPKRPKLSTESDDEADFCIICLDLLPKHITKSNSTVCKICQRPIHRKCTKMCPYICKHCQKN